ncbi:MAG: flagellar basal body-associated FliL family protein [Myxococcota bacterium]|nr:flagellar basal body-associated FliL family protein [Myxococcota bacterium]
MAEVANEMTNEGTESEETAPEAPATGLNKKKLVIIGFLAFTVLLVTALVGVVITLLLSKSPAPVAPPAPNQPNQVAETPAAAPAPEKKKRRKRREGESVNVPLKAFVINLADADAPRYLKVDITLQIVDKEAEKEVEQYNATVRDTILAYLSGLSAQQTVGPIGKSDMKYAIKKSINDVLPSAPVERVFFTQFIVQWDQP